MADFWLEQGWFRDTPAGRKLTNARWSTSPALRRSAVRYLFEVVLRKDPRDATTADFQRNRLNTLLYVHFDNVYSAVAASFPELDIQPWEMQRTPLGFFDAPQRRADAVRWLVAKLGKDPRDLTREDFRAHRLSTLATHYGMHSLVAETFPELDIQPWEMHMTAPGYFSKPENRVAALRWLAKRLGKYPWELKHRHLQDNRLRVLSTACGMSLHELVREAFPEYDLRPWEMSRATPTYFDAGDTRKAAVQWLVEKLDKPVSEISQADFRDNDLAGLLANHYQGSPYDALLDAGVLEGQGADGGVLRPWEMARTPTEYFRNKENRATAVRWLVELLAKPPAWITARDFLDNGLTGLLRGYYPHAQPYAALRESGLLIGLSADGGELRPWEMRHPTPGLFDRRPTRVAAVKWLLRAVGKPAARIDGDDFTRLGLGGLLRRKYGGDVRAALREARLLRQDGQPEKTRRGRR